MKPQCARGIFCKPGEHSRRTDVFNCCEAQLLLADHTPQEKKRTIATRWALNTSAAAKKRSLAEIQKFILAGNDLLSRTKAVSPRGWLFPNI